MANVIKYNITTNFNTYSEDFTQGSYSTISVSKTPNSVVTPFGNTNSTLVSRLSTIANSYISKTMLTSETRTVWTLSVYAKLGTVSTNFGLRCQGGYPNRGDALFNLSTGTLIGVSNGGTNTSTSGTITPDVNGWYRCTVTTTFSGTSSSRLLVCSPTALTSVSGFEASDGALSNCYIYGVQLELGSVATTYIPTTTTSASGSNNPLINAIQSGNFAIGVNQGGYGLTAATGYWNGKTPNVSGYTIYQANGFSSPTLYAAANDAELIVYSNQLGGSGNSTIGQALTFFNSSSTMTCVNVDTPSIVTSGLTLNLDAGFTPSYPRTGTTWTDISGSGNTGTLFNGPVYDGNSGGCIVFDGSDDFVAATSASLSGSAFTLEAWVKPSVIQALSSNIFLSIGSNAIPSNVASLGFSSDTSVQFVMYDDKLSGTIPSVTGNWNYVVSTLTTSKTLSIYYNGSFVTSKTMGGLYSGNTNVTVGAYNVGTKVAHFNGCIANVQIYNRVLSATEVLQNYYAGLQRFIPTDSLVLYLDGNNTNTQVITPTIANDISGNNNNGTLINNVALARDGQRSFLFDGTNDYIDLGSSTLLSTATTNISVSVWFKYITTPVGSNTIIKFGASGNGWLLGFSSGGFYYNLYTTTYTYFGGGISLPSINVWSNLTFTFNGNTFIMYLNGTTVVNTPSSSGTITNGGSTVVNVGRDNGSNYFTGNISVVRGYNQTLSAAEVLTIYNAGKQRYGL